MSQFISREDLKTLITFGAKHTLVEALPGKYYETEHLPGAINISHDAIRATASRVITDKSEPIIVYCASAECRNSHVAAEALRQMGYNEVYEYREGKRGWKEAGLPLATGGGAK